MKLGLLLATAILGSFTIQAATADPFAAVAPPVSAVALFDYDEQDPLLDVPQPPPIFGPLPPAVNGDVCLPGGVCIQLIISFPCADAGLSGMNTYIKLSGLPYVEIGIGTNGPGGYGGFC